MLLIAGETWHAAGACRAQQCCVFCCLPPSRMLPVACCRRTGGDSAAAPGRPIHGPPAHAAVEPAGEAGSARKCLPVLGCRACSGGHNCRTARCSCRTHTPSLNIELVQMESADYEGALQQAQAAYDLMLGGCCRACPAACCACCDQCVQQTHSRAWPDACRHTASNVCHARRLPACPLTSGVPSPASCAGLPLLQPSLDPTVLTLPSTASASASPS